MLSNQAISWRPAWKFISSHSLDFRSSKQGESHEASKGNKEQTNQMGRYGYSRKHCGKNHSSAWRVQKHMAAHSNWKWTSFVVNSLNNNTLSDLGADGGLVFKCEFCTIFFKSADERSVHMKTAHQENLRCKICGKLFSRRNSLSGHMRAHFNTPRKRKISPRGDEESEQFPPDLSGDSQSKEREVKEKRFTCNYCDKKYICQSRLDKHIVEHGKMERLIFREKNIQIAVLLTYQIHLT